MTLRVAHLYLAFPIGVRVAQDLLRDHPVATRLAEEQAALGAVSAVFARFPVDDDLESGGVRYVLRRDDATRQMPARTTLPLRLYRELLAFRPDVVRLAGFVFPGHVAALRALLPPRSALLVQYHDERPPRRALARFVTGRLLRAADGVLFTAPQDAAGWRRELAGVPVLPLAPGSTDFEPVPAPEPLPGRPSVVWVKRLTEAKDPLTAVRAFGEAAARLPGARLTMVFGEGELREAVRALVESDPVLAARVELRGRVDHERLPALLSAADVFLTSSLRESTNFALLEALACGASVAASDIPAHRALTAGTDAALFPPGDAGAAAEAITVAAARAGEAERRARRRVFEERLSWRSLAARSLEAYEATLRKGPGETPKGLPHRFWPRRTR